MPNVNVQFNGQTIVIPSAVYADNVSNALVPTQALTPPALFIGNFYGLAPNTPTTFVLAQDAINAVRGAPSALYIDFATKPSPTLNGAQFLTLINAAPNLQSTATISSTAPAAVVNLTSTDYGAASNLLQYSVSAGTNAGYDIEIYDGYTNTGVSGQNIGAPFQLAYTGSATTVTVAVSGTATAAQNLIVTSSNPGESFTIPLGANQYGTIGQVIAYLNGTGFYSATLLSNANLPSSNLDLLTATALPIATLGAYNYVTLTATAGDLIYWVNQYASNLCTAVLASGAVLTTAATLADVGLTHFTGGQNVPPTNTNYANAFNAALGTPAWSVFCDSNSLAVQALGAQHAITASSTAYGMWRRFVTGSNVGDSVTLTAQQARQLNSIETCYCYPGIYYTNTSTGANTLVGGLAWAAAAAGIMAGNIIAQPLTNQQLTGNGVELAGGNGSYLSVSQINTLQQAGVMVLGYPSTNVPTIVSDLTVWQGDNNPENVFTQQVACRWGLAYSLAAAVQPYIGTIASPYGMTRVKNAVVKQLNNLKYSPGNNGILVSWDPASLVLNYNGATQALSITVNVVLVGQIRFILEQTFVQPLNLSA